jgi:hypothetical protein
MRVMTMMLSKLDLQLLRSTAVILENDDGTPWRRIEAGHQHKAIGDYPSAKCGRTFTWEAREERGLFIRSEVDSEVIKYLSQPHEVRLVFDGMAFSYFPDLRRDQTRERVQIIEVKKDRREVERDPWYEIKLMLARHVYESRGWTFEIYDKKRIYLPEQVWDNARHIHERGRLAIPQEINFAVVDHLLKRDGLSRLGLLAELIGGWVRGRALLEAMHVHRIISIDLALPVAPGTEVSLINDRDLK